MNVSSITYVCCNKIGRPFIKPEPRPAHKRPTAQAHIYRVTHRGYTNRLLYQLR